LTLLHVTATGDDAGPLVVLVHGSMDRGSSFGHLARRLRDLHVVRYDRRGYGRSIDAGPANTFDAQVDDLGSVVAGRPAVLVGHSFGGVVALAFAARPPDLVRAVVAYEAPTPWEPWWAESSAGDVALDAADPGDAAERFMRRMVGDRRWERLPVDTRAERRAEGDALVAELRAVRRLSAPPWDPAGLRMPVLLAHGSESSERHVRTTVELAHLLPGAVLHVVDGAGHGVHLTHAEQLAGLVRTALTLVEG
jgi:pimeloyl-ACP methyl ester carboxylesterase